MDKIKVIILDGPKEIINYFGDNAQLVDDLESANIVVVAGDTEVSPEYYYSTTVDEKKHDPVKDFKLLKDLRSLPKINRRAIIVGLKKGAGYVDIIANGRAIQTKILPEKEITVVPSTYHDGQTFPEDTSFTVTSYEHYAHCEGRNCYKLLSTFNGSTEIPILYRYNATIFTSLMVAIHIDPFKLDPNSKEWSAFRAIIMNSVHLNIDPIDTVLKNTGDTSIWASSSKVSNEMDYPLEPHACFGSMVRGPLSRFGSGNNSVAVDWTIKVMKRNGWRLDNGRCITFMKKEEYEDYYKKLQEMYPFDFEIDDSNENYVMINLHIDAPCMWHKIILTQIRYIYQYCMCYILDDALTLQKMKEYKDMNILDIMNVVAKTIQYHVYESNEYMLYGYNATNLDRILKPFNAEEFALIAKKEGERYECPQINTIGHKYTMNTPKGFKYIRKEFPCFISWDTFKKSLDVRMPYYKNNLEIFKKLMQK